MIQLTFLGCGASGGVPLANGHWGRACAAHPYNRRSRSSLFIQIHEEAWLIDAGPDLRAQCLAHGIKKLDGVLLTHGHGDHILGLGELSAFAYDQKKPVPIYGDIPTLETVERIFGHCLAQEYEKDDAYSPLKFLVLRPLKAPFFVAKTPVAFFKQPHGSIHSLGFRFPSFAYSTDLSHLTDEGRSSLKNLDLWIVACTYWTVTTSAHGNLAQVLHWITEIQPKQAILTHMSFDIDYESLVQKLPSHITPGFDGMTLTLNC
jgi:phosphoribosyl 1,2-cyclic phosphate phosphodiesterase